MPISLWESIILPHMLLRENTIKGRSYMNNVCHRKLKKKKVALAVSVEFSCNINFTQSFLHILLKCTNNFELTVDCL